VKYRFLKKYVPGIGIPPSNIYHFYIVTNVLWNILRNTMYIYIANKNQEPGTRSQENTEVRTMKTMEDIIKKCITLMLLALYFFMVSTYILYLPKYTGPSPSISTRPVVVHLHKDNSTGNLFVQIHGAFKSVPENKRKTADVLIKIAALVFLLLFSGVTLPALIRKTRVLLNAFRFSHQHYYLSLRTLRI
jgi:hypothetical protein